MYSKQDFDLIKDKYPLLDDSDIMEILKSETPKKELEFRLEVYNSIKEGETILNLRKKLNKIYSLYENENKKN